MPIGRSGAPGGGGPLGGSTGPPALSPCVFEPGEPCLCLLCKFTAAWGCFTVLMT